MGLVSSTPTRLCTQRNAVRRRKDTEPAAEIQQNLLPPRLARVNGADLAEIGLRAILAELGPRSAATTVRGLQDAVINVSPDALRDDATMLVIAPHD